MGPFDRCPYCEEWRKKNCRYCGDCGRFLTPKNEGPSLVGSIRNILYWNVLLSITIVIFVAVCAFTYCFTNLQGILSSIEHFKVAVYIPLGLTDIVLFKVEGDALVAYTLILLFVELAFFIYAVIRFMMNLHDSEFDLRSEKVERSGLTALSSVLAVSLLLSVMYILFTMAIGSTPDSSWLNDYTHEQLAFMYMNAGLMEEITTRVMYIGVPMTIVMFMVYRKKSAMRYVLGGFGQTKLAWILIILSSIIFGLEHYEGWGWSKVLDATLSGILFGYLYMEYGLYASVIAHMVNDTFTLVTYLGLGEIVEAFAIMGYLFLGVMIVVYWILSEKKIIDKENRMEFLPILPEEGKEGFWKRH